MIRKEKNRGNPRHSVVWVGRSEIHLKHFKIKML